MAISGLGFGMYMAVDLALVADVLLDTTALQRISACSTSPTLFRSPSRRRTHRPSWRSAVEARACCTAVAGACAIIGAVAILPVKRCSVRRAVARMGPLIALPMGDHDLGAGVLGLQVPNRIGGSLERIGAVDDRGERVWSARVR